jgi:hypothetical protein
MAKMDLAFQLSANASGMDAGVKEAVKKLENVGNGAQRASAEFREAAKITKELRTPTEVYADTIGKLDKMLAKGLLSQEVYARAVTKADAELKKATSSAEDMARAASGAARVINGLSGAIEGVGNATKSVADAGVSVIAFGKDVAWTYLQWKVFSALRSPAGLKDFAVGALKATMTARTLVLAAKAMGVGLAIGGGAAGTAAAAVLGLTNPLVGGALLAYNLGTAFLDAKDRAYELARGVGELNGNLAALKADLGDIRVDQLDNLAFALEEVDAAGKRSSDAFSAFGDVFVTPFVGAFAAINSGLAGLTDGISSITEGITSILAPIGQVLAPVLTLFGTAIEFVLKLIGVLGDVVGIILKVAGAALHTFLSPFIVGLTNVVDTIRSGMNAAFDFIGSRIDWASEKIKDFYAYMSKVPIIGRAFAGGQKAQASATNPVAANAGNADAAAKEAAAAAAEEAREIENVNKAIERQRSVLSGAIDKSSEFGQAGFDAAVEYQNQLQKLEAQLEAGILNETSFAAAAGEAKTAFDAQIAAIEERNNAVQQMAEEDAKAEQSAMAARTKQTEAFYAATEDAQKFGEIGQKAAEAYMAGLMSLDSALEDGRINETEYAREADKLRKKYESAEQHAEDVAQAEENVAKASKFKEDNIAALKTKSNEALQGNDVRSSEGIKTFMALMTGREDPALEENRKANAKLTEMVRELRALQQAPVEILGAAA